MKLFQVRVIFPIRVLIAWLLLSCGCGSLCYGVPLGSPGTSALYVLEADPAERPEYERSNKMTVVSARLALGPVKRVGGKDYQWYELSFERLNGQRYTMWILIDRWPKADRIPDVADYLWLEPNWPDAVAYVNENTGKPELPRMSLWRHGWPQQPGADPKIAAPVDGLPERIYLHGYSFKRTKLEKNSRVTEPLARTIVKLNPDLIIGHINQYYDTEGRHRYAIGKSEHQFLQSDDEQWKMDMQSGLNLHHATLPVSPWLWRSGVYIARMFASVEDWPAHLYRSNFWGRAVFLDEPAISYAISVSGREDLASITPAQSVGMLQKRVSEPLMRGDGEDQSYSLEFPRFVVDSRFGRGNMYLRDPGFPVWEAAWASAWYVLAVEPGVCGIVDEDLYPEVLVEQFNMTFGTQIPATVQNACKLQIAVLRGACRNFNKRWGTAIYSYSPGALQPKIDLTALKEHYDAGATYFWFWNGWPGVDEAHVPYPYKRAYATSIRQFYKENPNRDMNVLLRVAKTCIVLPYGYTFCYHPLQGVSWLHMNRVTPFGVTYRQVLANAVLEAERCIRDGVAFDIAIDEPNFKQDGYDELIFVREDGSVCIRRTGKPEQILESARTPNRPNLGAMPSVSVSVVNKPNTTPGEIVLKADGKPGTGELVAELGGNVYYLWEIYLPNGNYESRYGQTITVSAKGAGCYRFRVSVADCFGRPAHAEMDIELP